MTTKKTTAQEVQEAEARIAADSLVHRLDAITTATEHAEKDPILAAEGMTPDELAEHVAAIQDVRARLGLVERDLTTALGKALGKATGNLADGRQFTVSRSADRVAWNHDDWKRDARRVITSEATTRYALAGTELDGDPLGFIVDTATGEEVALARVIQEALATAQEVHGSQAPRSRSLKTLGLYASDYCTSTPSGWRFTALKPTTKEDTTDD